MTPEERESIILEAVERAMLVVPDVWANLINDHKYSTTINADFQKAHSEFKGHGDIVTSVVAEIDGTFPLLSHEAKLKKAAPIIRERIGTTKRLDMKNVNRTPSRKLPSMGSNGEL